MQQTQNKRRRYALFFLIFCAALAAALYFLFFFKPSVEEKEKTELLPPAAVNASDGRSSVSVKVEWEHAGDGNIYSLFRSDGGEFVLISDALKSTRYDDANIAQGTLYYYKVRSGNVTDWSEFTPKESGYAFLQTPQIEYVSKGRYPDKITLRFNSVNGAQKYELFRADVADGEYKILSGELKKSSYTDKKIEPGREYYYKIKAKGRDFSSGFSDIESGYAYVRPTKAIASNGTVPDGIKVWWDEIDGAQRYALYRSDAIDGEYSLLDDSLTDKSYLDNNISNGKEYYYRIKTHQNGKWSRFSKADRGFASLAAPANVVASDGSDTSQITISWNEVKDAKKYALYRSIKDRKNFTLLNQDIRKTAYADRDVLQGVRYHYRLKAINEHESQYSKTDEGHAALIPPQRVLATDGSRDKIIISWKKSANADHYELYRSLDKEKGFRLISKNIKTDYFEDRGVEKGKSYYYRLKAANRSFISAYSDTESGYTGVNTPAGLRASDGLSPYHIDLSWDEADVEYYRVYRANRQTGSYVPISGLIKENGFHDINISNCTTYYYKIAGFKNQRESDFTPYESGYGKCGAFVTTYAGSGVMGSMDSEDFNRPAGVAVSGKKVYVADTFNHQIRVIDADGKVNVIAGSGDAGSEDGMKRNAAFYMPTGITVTTDGSIYVAEVDNHLIRKVSPQGEVTTFAGSGSKGYKDGFGREAEFSHPYKITADKEENLYVSEFGNNKIRKITKEAKVTTIAGSAERGNRDGSADYAQFNNPAGIAVDNDGNIYVSDSSNNNIRKIAKDGRVVSLAGSKKAGHKDGRGIAASFNDPRGLAIDAKGNIFVADTGNHAIRMITPDGNVKTIAGSFESGSDDGYGTDASFFSPMDVSVDGEGNIYVAGYHNHKIRKITISSSPKNPTGAD